MPVSTIFKLNDKTNSNLEKTKQKINKERDDIRVSKAILCTMAVDYCIENKVFEEKYLK